MKLAEEKAMLHTLEMEQHACDVREQGKVSAAKSLMVNAQSFSRDLGALLEKCFALIRYPY